MYPRTPDADEEPRTRTDDPDAIPGPKAGRASPDSRTSDEINRMLSSSLEQPEPDPMLGGPGSWDPDKVAVQPGGKRTRPGDGLNLSVDVASASKTSLDRAPAASAVGRTDWPGVLLKSYASAVTLALIWVLWTGRSTQPSSHTPSLDPATARRRALEEDLGPSIDPETPSERSTVLGKPLIVGDLEILPLTILRKGVRASFEHGSDAEVRDFPGCLALTLRLKNRGMSEPLVPIDELDLKDRTAFMIEAPPGGPIALFDSGPRAGWKVDDQEYPSIPAGGVEDVVLISEPVPKSRLTSSMIWRFRLSCGPDGSRRTDLAVRFGQDDVPGVVGR